MNVELFDNSFCVCGLSMHPEINQFLIVASNMLSQGINVQVHLILVTFFLFLNAAGKSQHPQKRIWPAKFF